jgi:hypothetical protein
VDGGPWTELVTRSKQGNPLIPQHDQNDDQGYGIEKEQALVFGYGVGHSFGGRPRYGDQDDGNEHTDGVLHGPVAELGVLHGLVVELNNAAYEIAAEAEQELNVGKDEQQEAQQVVGLTEGLFAGKADQRIDDNGYEHEKYEVAHSGVRGDQKLHGNNFGGKIVTFDQVLKQNG